MPLDTYGRLEVMGHQSFVGKLSEEVVAGISLVRIDVTAGDKVITKLFGGTAIYCITPMTEEEVKEIERYTSARPRGYLPPTIAFDEQESDPDNDDFDDSRDEQDGDPLDDEGVVVEEAEPARPDMPF